MRDTPGNQAASRVRGINKMAKEQIMNDAHGKTARIDSEPTMARGPVMRRRGLVAAAVLAAGAVAKNLTDAQPVAAYTFSEQLVVNFNDPNNYATSIANTGTGGGLYSNSAGIGVNGRNYSTSVGYAGVYGQSVAGSGVFGISSGTSGNNSFGVFGRNATGSPAPAVVGASSGVGAGVLGQGPSNGVYGVSTGTDPNVAIGVFGTGAGGGVYGSFTGDPNNGAGVQGASSTGYGVYGNSTAPTTSPKVAGVAGVGSNGDGVFGFSSAAGYPFAGVRGNSPNTYGVSGASTTSVGVVGSSTRGIGVYGITGGGMGGISPYGVVGAAQAAPGFGLYGVAGVAGTVGFAAGAIAGAIAGQFSGPVNMYDGHFTIDGSGAPANTVGLVVMNGATKNAAVPVADGSYRLLHCVEAPEPWFEDFGTGTLAGGKAEIKLDPDFLASTNTAQMHVFFTPHDEHHALHLAGKNAGGFSVGAVPSTVGTTAGHTAGTLNGTFTWRVVAKRKDVSGERFAHFTPPKQVKVPALAMPSASATAEVKAPTPLPTRTAPAILKVDDSLLPKATGSKQ